MRLSEVSKQVFELASKYENDGDSQNLRTRLAQVSDIVKNEPQIHGSFSYSPDNLDQPLMAVFYETNQVLTFTFGANKFLVSFTENRINRMKLVEPKTQMETPMIKVEFAKTEVEKEPKLMYNCTCRDCRRRQKQK